VANRLPPEPDVAEENINSLESRLSAPLLGIIPALDVPTAGQAAKYLATETSGYT
jgi:dethiobiotin synthetase